MALEWTQNSDDVARNTAMHVVTGLSTRTREVEALVIGPRAFIAPREFSSATRQYMYRTVPPHVVWILRLF